MIWIDEMDKTTEDINTKQEEIDAKETELIQAQIDENNQYEYEEAYPGICMRTVIHSLLRFC